MEEEAEKGGGREGGPDDSFRRGGRRAVAPLILINSEIGNGHKKEAERGKRRGRMTGQRASGAIDGVRSATSLPLCTAGGHIAIDRERFVHVARSGCWTCEKEEKMRGRERRGGTSKIARLQNPSILSLPSSVPTLFLGMPFFSTVCTALQHQRCEWVQRLHTAYLFLLLRLL